MANPLVSGWGSVFACSTHVLGPCKGVGLFLGGFSRVLILELYNAARFFEENGGF